jgi:enoyl-CoA hydratase
MSGKKNPLYENIILEFYGSVGLITLNRPHTMNALSHSLFIDLENALNLLEKDPHVHVIVLTGSSKVFAAGADIKELKDKTFQKAYEENFIGRDWECLLKCRKPLIAAVAGLALGGGCEIALMCDFIIAAENVQFGQPEIHLGMIPGAGGTQRLTRLIGKSKAMDMCLTGRMMGAQEAERSGLVSRLLPLENFIDEVVEIAQHIAAMPKIAQMMIKEAVNAAYETTLREGIRLERQLFYATFSTAEQKEGMSAFIEKRDPHFYPEGTEDPSSK